MGLKITLLLLATILSFFGLTKGHNMNECPDEDRAKHMAGTAWIDVAPERTTTAVRRVRLPQVGLYEHPIVCILATDTTLDDSGGDVEITEGGLEHRYVEIRFNSNIGKGLDYLVIVYTENAPSMNNTVNKIN